MLVVLIEKPVHVGEPAQASSHDSGSSNCGIDARGGHVLAVLTTKARFGRTHAPSRLHMNSGVWQRHALCSGGHGAASHCALVSYTHSRYPPYTTSGEAPKPCVASSPLQHLAYPPNVSEWTQSPSFEAAG